MTVSKIMDLDLAGHEQEKTWCQISIFVFGEVTKLDNRHLHSLPFYLIVGPGNSLFFYIVQRRASLMNVPILSLTVFGGAQSNNA